MSGTSLDGLDLAYCLLQKSNGSWQYGLKQTKAISYTPEMRERLKTSIDLNAVDLLVLHNQYGAWLGEQVAEFIRGNGLEVDFISSHGHTVHHRPELGLTLQIGSGQHLANACTLPVVCDFRTNDVALGGQGAPLVPIGDRLFFGNFDFCLNLGGISNVSFELNGSRVAYDIGIANMLLNHITRKIGLEYDAGGVMARSGTVNPALLAKLNALPYYALPFPKSVGYEWFLAEMAPIVDGTVDTTENLLHTAVVHIAKTIADGIGPFAGDGSNSLLATGGGALNTFLMDKTREFLGPKLVVTVPDRSVIEFKEALVFALMGALRMNDEINVLSSVTGALRNSSSGVLFIPQ